MLDRPEQATDKSYLRSLVENDYTLPDNIDSYAFATALLANFASTDAELRDELSYMLLARGIVDKGRLAPDQMRELLVRAVDDEHLFTHIGEVGTDSVFMRSFSNLLVAVILYADSKQPHLPEEAVRRTKQALLNYARQERDWRGYVEGKGWAHALAHLADALDECAQHPTMGEADRVEILNLVSELAKLQVPLYNEEDIRLASVPYHIMLGKQVPDDLLASWIEECFVERGIDVASWIGATNAKNFLRSLYFFLIWDGVGAGLAEDISRLLKKQDAVYVEKAGEEV